MKVYRYMSQREFAKMSAGCPMIHCGNFKARTNSKGFCFLPEIIEAVGWEEEYKFTPEQCILFLFGIVSDDVLVEFETSETMLETLGSYCDPYTYDNMVVSELCTPIYDRDTFIPLRYAIPKTEFFSAEFDWYDFR